MTEKLLSTPTPDNVLGPLEFGDSAAIQDMGEDINALKARHDYLAVMGEGDMWQLSDAAEREQTYLVDRLNWLDRRESEGLSEKLDSALNSTDHLTLTKSAIDFLRWHPKSVGYGWYTEVYVNPKGETVIMPAPRQLVAYGASITGSHALTDELRMYDGFDFPNFMALANRDQLGDASLKAKGLLRFDDVGRGFLELQSIASVDLSWLDDLTEHAAEQGLEGPIVINKYRSNHEQLVDPHHRSVKTRVSFDYADVEPLNLDVNCEIATAIDVSTKWERSHDNPNILQPHDHLIVHALRGRTAFHRPLYEHVNFKDEHGYVAFNWRGKDVQVGVRTTLDHRNHSQSINLFLGDDYGADGRALEISLIDAFAGYLNHDRPVLVTVAHGGNTPAALYQYFKGDLTPNT